jgi:CHAD domain-containing protein
MAGSKQTEIERKYDVDIAAVVPDLTGLDGVATIEVREPVTLAAVYYDTDAADLARHSITLRRREGGGDAGWHVKKPADEGRTEFQWPLDVDAAAEADAAADAAPVAEASAAPNANADADAAAAPDADAVAAPDTDAAAAPVPGEVLEPVRAIVRDRQLAPLARIMTTRTVVRLVNTRGEGIAEVADDEVSASDVRTGGYRRWREWEVELLEAPPATRKERTAFLDAVEQRLVAAGAQPSASPSKLARALGVESLTELEASDEAAGRMPRLVPGTAASVVVPALRDLVDALVAGDPAVRSDETDAVHQMRRVVSTVRSVLRTYRRLFDRAAVDVLLDHLDRLGDALGEARDAEVRRARAAAALEALPVQDADAEARLVAGDRQAYADSLARVRRLLGSESYFRLLDALDEFVATPPLSERAAKPAKGQVRKAVRRQVKRLRRRADAAQASDIDMDAALHETRKAARRLQRATSAVTPALRPRQAKTIHRITGAAKPIVRTLGDHRDGRLFDEHLRIEAQRARAAGEDTFVYGLLIGGGSGQADDDVLVSLRVAVRRIERAARRL